MDLDELWVPGTGALPGAGALRLCQVGMAALSAMLSAWLNDLAAVKHLGTEEPERWEIEEIRSPHLLIQIQ